MQFFWRFKRFFRQELESFVKHFLGEEQPIFHASTRGNQANFPVCAPGAMFEIFGADEADLVEATLAFSEGARREGKIAACITSQRNQMKLPGALTLTADLAEDALQMCLELLRSDAIDLIVLNAWLEAPIKTEMRTSLFSDPAPHRRRFFEEAIEKLAKKASQHRVCLLLANPATTERSLLSHTLNLYCNAQKQAGKA